MENERLEQYGGVVSQILARRGWGLVQDEEAFIAEVLEDVQRRFTEQAPQSRRPLAKVIEDATINRYGHIWHAACGASGTPRQGQAFEELHQQLYPVAYKVVHQNKYLAEESAQEALIIINQKLSQVNDQGTFLRWANVIVRRKAIRLLEKEKKRLEREEPDSGSSGDSEAEQSKIEKWIPRDDSPPSDTRDVREIFEETIKYCLKRSKQGANVIIRSLLDERSVKQVADELGIKPNDIYRITHRAKDGLRKCQDFLTLVKRLHLIDFTVPKGG